MNIEAILRNKILKRKYVSKGTEIRLTYYRKVVDLLNNC